MLFVVCCFCFRPVWAEPDNGQTQNTENLNSEQSAQSDNEKAATVLDENDTKPKDNTADNDSTNGNNDINKTSDKNAAASQTPKKEQPSNLGGILPIVTVLLSAVTALLSLLCLIKTFAVANFVKKIIRNQNKNIDILGSNFSDAANQICDSCSKINSNVNKVWECLLNTAPSEAKFQPSQPIEPPRPKTSEEQIDDAVTNGVNLELLGMKPVEITYQSGMYFLQQTAGKLFYRKNSSDGMINIYPGSKISDPAWANRYDEYFDTVRLGNSGKVHIVSPALFYLNTNSGVTEFHQKGRVEIN